MPKEIKTIKVIVDIVGSVSVATLIYCLGYLNGYKAAMFNH
jgi:hypothetical protein|nr:MAG TPA: protein of unknown function (DUF4731) [Caudoviricetes sp.]